MNKYLVIISIIFIGQISNLRAIEYEELYTNGKVSELKQEIYSKPVFDKTELPRAAYYESLVTSKNFDKTLKELIEGFPEISFKDQINFKLGVINFFQRKYSQAEFYFAKVENTEHFYEYNYWLARLYFMKQDHKKSSSYANIFLKNCEKIDHKYELTFYMLIENSISENNFQKAVVLAEELLINKPEGINKEYLYYRIGYSYERLENIALAVANYKKSFEIDPYGQYAALTEERLFELKKGVNKNIDISFLYNKNYSNKSDKEIVTFKTKPKQFNVTELVRTDTSTVLSKYFNNQYDQKIDSSETETIIEQKINLDHNTSQQLLAENSNDDDYILDNKHLPNKNEENRSINQINDNTENGTFLQRPENTESNGSFLERPENIENESYIFLMNKPVGNYFIQIGRFSSKESAINRTKEIFFLQQTWNIFRDVNDNMVTYVIWTQPYENSTLAKKDIAYFKSKGIDCFLISNE